MSKNNKQSKQSFYSLSKEENDLIMLSKKIDSEEEIYFPKGLGSGGPLPPPPSSGSPPPASTAPPPPSS